jgi:DNA-binding Xre family transcriptional regulator
MEVIVLSRKLPFWCKETKKAMIDKELSVQQLAEDVGMTREYVSALINGRVLSPNAQKTICTFLNISSNQ